MTAQDQLEMLAIGIVVMMICIRVMVQLGLWGGGDDE